MPAEPPSSQLSQALVTHLGRIQGHLLVLGADRTQAEEVIQELAVSAASAAGDGEVITEPLAWLLTAARRRFIDLLRRSTVRRQRELPVEGLSLAIEDALAEHPEEEDSMAELEVATLRRCLARLAPKARELINLRYWSNLSPLAIAERLEWGDASVRVALSKARRTLEECMRRALPATGANPAEPSHG
jgi:RNA polymerase sigma factor (sigma-70 family)